jgi:DNA repair ATPase RecN
MALELGTGMTVLTGETGAGKSLLVDALLLLSGARSDASWVRAGCERAELSAEFDAARDARWPRRSRSSSSTTARPAACAACCARMAARVPM